MSHQFQTSINNLEMQKKLRQFSEELQQKMGYAKSKELQTDVCILMA